MSANQALMKEYKYKDTRYILYNPPPSNWCYGVATIITGILVLICYSIVNYAMALV